MQLLIDRLKVALLLGACSLCAYSPTAPAQDRVPLDKLDRCVDLKKIQSLVENNQLGGLCRAARSSFEKVMDDKAKVSMMGASYCFSDPPSAQMLEGFSCVQTDFAGSRGLTCFKTLSANVLEDYKHNYHSRYRADVERYLTASLKCSDSGRGVVADPMLVAPMMIMDVARMSFRFVLPVGASDIPSSLIGHGFASVDQSIGRNMPEAIELLTFTSSASQSKRVSLNEKVVGDIAFSMERETKLERDFMRMMPRQAGALVSAIDVQLRKRPLTKGSIDDYSELVPSIMDWVAETAESEGFDEVDSGEPLHAGHTMDEVMDGMENRIPYGMQGSGSVDFERTARMFMTDNHVVCRGEGAMLVATIRMRPRRKTLDLGSLGVIVLGVGQCGTSPSGKRYIASITEQLTRTIGDGLTTGRE